MPTSLRYLVTGGAGFIGANLVAELVRRYPGADVTVLDDCSSGSFTNLVEACERAGVGPFAGRFLPVGLADVDPDEMIDALEPDAVFHLAAITDTTVGDERHMLEENTSSFPGILHACVERHVRLVYASSAATYGTPSQALQRVPFPEEAAGAPNNVYGFSKWMMEQEHQRLVREDGPESARASIVGLRYFNVYGPGESRKGRMASMAYQLAQQMLAGGRPRLFKGGEQARDQVHVDDVVACTLAAAGLGPRPIITSGVYNLGSGRATTFNEIANAVRVGLGLTGEDRPTEYFDMPPDIREFYQDYTCADMSAALRGLGFEPAVDPLEGIAAYARRLKERHEEREARRAGVASGAEARA